MDANAHCVHVLTVAERVPGRAPTPPRARASRSRVKTTALIFSSPVVQVLLRWGSGGRLGWGTGASCATERWRSQGAMRGASAGPSGSPSGLPHWGYDADTPTHAYDQFLEEVVSLEAQSRSCPFNSPSSSFPPASSERGGIGGGGSHVTGVAVEGPGWCRGLDPGGLPPRSFCDFPVGFPS
jgi:hypothetical protein